MTYITEKPVMRDQLLMRDHCCGNMALLHFYTFVPAMKDDLSYKTTFCGPGGGLSSRFHCIMNVLQTCIQLNKCILNRVVFSKLNVIFWCYQVHEGINVVQDHVEQQKPVLAAAMIPLPTLHLTIMVMHLATQQDISR